MKSLILFDVDGTLTRSRLTIEKPMLETLKSLTNLEEIDIGIVGGSDIKKQKEQLGEKNLKLFKWIFSENGLDAYKNGIQISCENIVEKMGEESFTKLVNICLLNLSKCKNPVKRGTFIEYRNGMLNISPVGRKCSQEEREKFSKDDDINKYRQQLIKSIKSEWNNYMVNSDICTTELSFSVGGQISIDIFPKGWDKTYCLKFVEEKYKKIYFFGDKTHEGGNDHEIFMDERTESFTVKNPNDTINFLNNIIFKKYV